jgi:hypothetical protein
MEGERRREREGDNEREVIERGREIMRGGERAGERRTLMILRQLRAGIQTWTVHPCSSQPLLLPCLSSHSKFKKENCS